MRLHAPAQCRSCHLSGSFPGNPITPGVCIIQIVSELLELQTQQKPELRNIANVKFLNILSPQEHPEVQAEIRLAADENGNYKIKAALKSGDTLFAQLSIRYADDSES